MAKKIMIITEKVSEEDDGGVVALINEGSSLKKEVESIAQRLSEIKEELQEIGLQPKIKYVTKQENSVTISETMLYEDMDPVKVRKALTAKRLGPKFIKCVKIQLSPLKRYLSEDEIATLRTEKKLVQRYTLN